jgi:hypothetical protein
MTQLTWILQTDIFTEYEKELQHIITTQQHNLILTHRTTKPPPINDPAIFYGSLNYFTKIPNNPGIYYNNILFSCASYYPLFKELLNINYIMLPYGDLLRNKSLIFNIFNNEIFIRPNSPSKIFTGFSIHKNDFEKEISYLNIDRHTLILIAQHQQIQEEYRFIIINNKIITHSGYSWNDTTPHVPQAAIDFTSALLNRFDYKNYVMDICKVNDQFYLLELNCINSSGLYDCDLTKFVFELSKIALEDYNEIFI